MDRLVLDPCGFSSRLALASSHGGWHVLGVLGESRIVHGLLRPKPRTGIFSLPLHCIGQKKSQKSSYSKGREIDFNYLWKELQTHIEKTVHAGCGSDEQLIMVIFLQCSAWKARYIEIYIWKFRVGKRWRFLLSSYSTRIKIIPLFYKASWRGCSFMERARALESDRPELLCHTVKNTLFRYMWNLDNQYPLQMIIMRISQPILLPAWSMVITDLR